MISLLLFNTIIPQNKRKIKHSYKKKYNKITRFNVTIHPTTHQSRGILVKFLIKGQFDFRHLCKIHEHIFQDLFDWAGKIRTVNISKNNIFCLVQHIPSYADTIFAHYYDDCNAAKYDPEKFINTLTDYYADINALHPFREGNGRTQREFTRELCLALGYDFDMTKTDHNEMLEASIESFNGTNTKLKQIFKKVITQIT